MPFRQDSTSKASKLNRVPAVENEQLIAAAVRKHLGAEPSHGLMAQQAISMTDKELIATHIVRVEVKPDNLLAQLAGQPDGKADTDNVNSLVVPWKKTPPKRPREIIPPAPTSPRQDQRPIRAETRAKLITAIAKGRSGWMNCPTEPSTTLSRFPTVRTAVSGRSTITLAFLAPTLVQAAVDGRLPRGIGVASLRDLPAEWTRQHQMLGLSS